MVNRIKAFKKEHADQIVSYGMTHKLMEIDAVYADNRICNYSQPRNAFTMFIDEKPVFAIGLVVLWQGVAEGWVIASQNVFDIKYLAAKTMKEITDELCKKNKIIRLQTSVKAEFKQGIRFATWLDMEIEGLKKNYGPDGSDYYQLARIFK